MPKRVDHEQYRQELASRAVAVFRAKGYHGLSMRAMADALGVSKGVLYHYFASKEALFAASSVYGTALPELVLAEQPSRQQQQAALETLALAMEADFAGELTLLLDYIRGRDNDAIAADSQLAQAKAHYLSALAAITGEDKAQGALAQILGVLLLRLFDGKQTGFDSLAPWLEG